MVFGRLAPKMIISKMYNVCINTSVLLLFTNVSNNKVYSQVWHILEDRRVTAEELYDDTFFQKKKEKKKKRIRMSLSG